MTAQNVQVDILAQGMWPQEDARDPLGVWGGRTILTGTVGGGPLKVRFSPGLSFAGAYLYTCYDVTIASLTAAVSAIGKCRLLTNWPDIDAVEDGVQGFSSLRIVSLLEASGFTEPFGGPETPLFYPSDRFMLLFDPRPVAGAFDIVELERDRSVEDDEYSFEAWGYYWDRQVMSTPGGPRHPGSR